MKNFRMLACGALLALAGVQGLVFAQAEAQKPADAAEQDVDPIAVGIKQLNDQDNGITINREQSYIDIQAKVCLRTGEFLEMFACTKDTREHESILVMDATPSTVHLALLLLGQEPGKPLSYDMAFDPPKLVPAKGPEVKVFVVREVDGKTVETPANEWIKDNKSGKAMADNTWLFAGSAFVVHEGKQYYLADINGSAISLVNFGDDLLTLAGTMTDKNESHDKVWAPQTDAIPAVGTKVVLRLKVKAAEKDAPQGGENAGQGPEPAKDAAEAGPAGGS